MNPDFVTPAPGMRRQKAVTRNALMDHLRAKELLGVTPCVTDSPKRRTHLYAVSRNNMRRVLVALKSKKYLAFNEKYVWLLRT